MNHNANNKIDPAATTCWSVKPRLCVLASSSFALGTFFAVYQIEASLIIMVIVSIFCLRKTALVTTRILLLCLICTSTGFLSTQFRTPKPAVDDICRYSNGGKLTAIGTLIKTKPIREGAMLRLLLRCKKVLDGSQSLKEGRVASGLLEVSVYSKKLEPKNALQKQELSWKEQELPWKDGDLLLVSGIFTPTKELKNRPLKLRLENLGIFCLAKVRYKNIELITKPPKEMRESIEEWTQSLRTQLLAHHQKALGKENGALLASMVLGDKAVCLDRKTLNEFRATGLSHILVASGFNLSIAAASIYYSLRLVTNKLIFINLCCFLAMLLYSTIAGPSASVLRALAMGSFILLAKSFSRTPHMPAVLSASLLFLLLIDPFSISDLGFQLSFLATAGIVFITPILDRLLKNPVKPGWLRTIVSATLGTQMLILPLQLQCFSQLCPYFLLSNIVILPLVPTLSIGGFANSMLFILESALNQQHFLSETLDKICALPILALRSAVSCISIMPFSLLNTGKANPGVLVFYYLAILNFWRPAAKISISIMIFLVSLILLLASAALSC